MGGHIGMLSGSNRGVRLMGKWGGYLGMEKLGESVVQGVKLFTWGARDYHMDCKVYVPLNYIASNIAQYGSYTVKKLPKGSPKDRGTISEVLSIPPCQSCCFDLSFFLSFDSDGGGYGH